MIIFIIIIVRYLNSKMYTTIQKFGVGKILGKKINLHLLDKNTKKKQ